MKCAIKDYLLAQSVRKIGVLCLKKDGSLSIIRINNISYVLEAKLNLLSLGQLSKREVDIKTESIGIILFKKEKTIMIESKIGYV